MRFLALFVVIIMMSCTSEQPNKSVEFKGDWEFKKELDTIWYKAEVPGVVHTDLLKNELIDDPYYGNNELDLQWIEEENWVYKTQFKLTSEESNYENVEIEFEGLDTYARVFLNDALIIESDNMFRNWTASIKEHLKIGRNELRVVFESPLKHHKERVEMYPYKLPSGNENVDLQVSNFTRKAAYHFGWDWGPRFVTAGIWRPVHLHFWNEVVIKDSYIKTDKITNNTANLSGIIELTSTSKTAIALAIQLKDSMGNLRELQS